MAASKSSKGTPTRWQIYLAATLAGAGTGFSFASMANLIVEAVPPGQTGVASGMNTIVRTIGGVAGADVVASILDAHLLASGESAKHGYTITFSVCAAVMLIAVLASLAVPGRRRRRHIPRTWPIPRQQRTRGRPHDGNLTAPPHYDPAALPCTAPFT